MAWSKVSKAALKSNSASTDTGFWFYFVRRPSSTLKTAVLVLWYFLYADCIISSKLFAQRWDCNWRTTLSSIFETNGRFEASMKFLKSLASRPSFFSMGVTSTSFNQDGTVPADKETLMILVTRRVGWGARPCRHRLVMVVGMGSRVQLFVGDWEMSLRISSSVTGSNMDNWRPSNLKNRMVGHGDKSQGFHGSAWSWSRKSHKNAVANLRRECSMAEK